MKSLHMYMAIETDCRYIPKDFKLFVDNLIFETENKKIILDFREYTIWWNKEEIGNHMIYISASFPVLKKHIDNLGFEDFKKISSIENMNIFSNKSYIHMKSLKDINFTVTGKHITINSDIIKNFNEVRKELKFVS